ncbi:DoxX family membrane protein [Palleronia caenipelagi]|uniref:DoxX family membrane protein n=1 Tax=Palleronia caenipelagi TaxID=2489174 RepID=A0A547Q2L4_9RHOB|nr:DoxX family membrane protein [Palleronia caenipelagi]TRD20633.1 DoxX family membrane protein [Palleronia caenipelagi]
MSTVVNIVNRTSDILERGAPILPLVARVVFAAVLAGYYWASAMTKLGDGPLGLFNPSVGAYAQIFPKTFDAVGYDTSAMSLWHTLVVLAGTWAEFLLPLLIILGLFTRLAALGMIGFVAVQTVVDLFGHGLIAVPETVGAWFDRHPDSAIMDQRSLWLVLFLTLVVKGGGLLSADRALGIR